MAKLLAFVLPLGLDTFAVAAALGLGGIAGAARRRVTAVMVAFEAGMPLIGVLAGAPLGHAVGGAADYVAVGVLLIFGLYTLLGGEGDEEQRAGDFIDARGLKLVALGVSISLDELAVGFSLGLLHLPVWLVISAIALQTLIVVRLGLALGSRIGERVREGAERLAGLALTVLALVLLAEQLF